MLVVHRRRPGADPGLVLRSTRARPGLWLAVGLLAGGALGNLADRVRDRTPSPTSSTRRCGPTFNLADIAITLGRWWCYRRSIRARHPDDAKPEPATGVSASRGSSTSTSAWPSIDKPAGLVVHAAPGHRGPTARRRARRPARRRRGPQRPGIVHRLDKDTSGLMIVARDDEAHRRLAAQIKAPRGPARPTWRWSRAGRARAPARSTPRSAATTARRSGAPSAAAAPRDGAHPLQVLELLPADALVEARLETGPHAPDPRPLRRDRPPGRRRPALRPAPGATASSASSCTARGSASATRSRARSSSSRSRAARGPGRGARARRGRSAAPPGLSALYTRAPSSNRPPA